MLCAAYVDDSFEAGFFLNVISLLANSPYRFYLLPVFFILKEEKYEWGNPKAESNLPKEIDAKTKKIARMNYKWRVELQLRSENEERNVGIFSGMRVILHSNRKERFARLLEAGCGVVVDLK